MKHLYCAIALSLGLAGATSAHAFERDLSLTYVDAVYQDIDGVADGFGLRGAYGLGDSDWYVHGKYSRLDISGLSGADFDLWEVGVGYSYPINQASDVVFDAAYQQMRFDGDSLDGYRVGAGVRTILGTPRLEGHAKAHFYTGGDSQSQWAANVGLNFFFTQSKRFSVIGEYEFADSGDDIFWIGLRASF